MHHLLIHFMEKKTNKQRFPHKPKWWCQNFFWGGEFRELDFLNIKVIICWSVSALIYFYLCHSAMIHHTFITQSDMPHYDIVQSDKYFKPRLYWTHNAINVKSLFSGPHGHYCFHNYRPFSITTGLQLQTAHREPTQTVLTHHMLPVCLCYSLLCNPWLAKPSCRYIHVLYVFGQWLQY